MNDKLKITGKMLKQGEVKLAFYSILAGITSRLKFWSLYRLYSGKRYKKCQDYLYRRIISSFDSGSLAINNNVEDQTNKEVLINANVPENTVIWTMWYQGYENAPQIVKDAIDSKKVHSNGHPVIVIDEDNLASFVSLPDYIYRKFDKGIFSLAHLSDIVRIELLYRYGGIWIDSTIFLVEDIPEYVFERAFWSLHWPEGIQRYWVASYDKWSVGVLASHLDNTYLRLIQKVMFHYLYSQEYLITYLLLDVVIASIYKLDSNFKNSIDRIESSNSHTFDFVDVNGKRGNQICDDNIYYDLRKDTWMFQLTYKREYKLLSDGLVTYAGRIRKDGVSNK